MWPSEPIKIVLFLGKYSWKCKKASHCLILITVKQHIFERYKSWQICQFHASRENLMTQKLNFYIIFIYNKEIMWNKSLRKSVKMNHSWNFDIHEIFLLYTMSGNGCLYGTKMVIFKQYSNKYILHNSTEKSVIPFIQNYIKNKPCHKFRNNAMVH